MDLLCTDLQPTGLARYRARPRQRAALIVRARAHMYLYGLALYRPAANRACTVPRATATKSRSYRTRACSHVFVWTCSVQTCSQQGLHGTARDRDKEPLVSYASVLVRSRVLGCAASHGRARARARLP